MRAEHGRPSRKKVRSVPQRLNMSVSQVWEMYKKAEASFWTGETEDSWTSRELNILHPS